MSRDVKSANSPGWHMCVCRCVCGHAAFSHRHLAHAILECRYCSCLEHTGCEPTPHRSCIRSNETPPSHRQYVPWCECGWQGERTSAEDAAAEAFTHATGRVPELIEKASRHKGPRQEEAVFNGREYDR
jgi:hypothetical protein